MTRCPFYAKFSARFTQTAAKRDESDRRDLSDRQAQALARDRQALDSPAQARKPAKPRPVTFVPSVPSVPLAYQPFRCFMPQTALDMRSRISAARAASSSAVAAPSSRE